jgi:hypothetical protein
MSSKDFKEDCIFEELKDKSYRNAKDFKERLMKKYKDIDASNMYLRVANYQIKKYGTILRGYNKINGDE